MVAACPHGWAAGLCFACLQEESEHSLKRQAPGFLCDRETWLVDYIRVNRISAFINLDCSTGMSCETAYSGSSAWHSCSTLLVPGEPV